LGLRHCTGLPALDPPLLRKRRCRRERELEELLERLVDEQHGLLQINQHKPARAAMSDDPLRKLREHEATFKFLIVDCKRHFGQWDSCDPVAWAILRVVQAQNDLSYAIDQDQYGDSDHVVEAAIAERIAAIAALQDAIKQEPRGFQ
jgi:antirestriction protein